MKRLTEKRPFARLYRNGFLIAIGIFLFPVWAYAQTTNVNWIGSYEFFDSEKSGLKNQPGNFATYTLVISKSSDRFTARFTADGTQISDDYECRVEAEADSIKVFFVKDLGGTEEGKAVPLKNGDLIFTLTKTVVGRKTKYLFRKEKYEIFPLAAPSRNKIYFNKKR